MADRDASFFGPILPQPWNAPEAFSFDELQRIRANRIAADMLRHGPSAWPERHRFQTMYPPVKRSDDLTPTDPITVPRELRRH
jgi:hypothetical protein